MPSFVFVWPSPTPDSYTWSLPSHNTAFRLYQCIWLYVWLYQCMKLDQFVTHKLRLCTQRPTLTSSSMVQNFLQGLFSVFCMDPLSISLWQISNTWVRQCIFWTLSIVNGVRLQLAPLSRSRHSCEFIKICYFESTKEFGLSPFMHIWKKFQATPFSI